MANLVWKRTSVLVYGAEAADANLSGVAMYLTMHEHVPIVKSSTNPMLCSAAEYLLLEVPEQNVHTRALRNCRLGKSFTVTSLSEVNFRTMLVKVADIKKGHFTRNVFTVDKSSGTPCSPFLPQ